MPFEGPPTQPEPLEVGNKKRGRVEIPGTEKKEIPEAQFGVIFDMEKLRQIDIKGIVEKLHFPGYGDKDEARQAKIVELKNVLEIITRLPEQLEFKPGITLIVGENGSGKTTLGKALFYITNIANKLTRSEVDRDIPNHKDQVFSDVLNPPKRDLRWTDLKNSGLSPHIARAMDIVAFQAHVSDIPAYRDFGKVTGGLAHRIDNQYADHSNQMLLNSMGSNQSGQSYRPEAFEVMSHDMGSNRQSIDAVLVRNILRMKKGTNGPQVGFFDEPETGMSPMRHMHLLEEVKSYSTEGSIVIVPTNSPILFANSKIPRIDLRYPERGIFKPEDYPKEE